MSETKSGGPSRRRANRTAGPPGGSGAAAASTGWEDAATEKLTGAAVAGAGSATEATVKTRPAADTEETVKLGKTAASDSDETVRLGRPGSDDADATVKLDSARNGKSADTETTVRLDKTDADTDTENAEKPEFAGERPKRSVKKILLTATAAVLAVGLVALAVITTLAVRANDAREDRRSEYVATARQTVLNLTTISADTAQQDIDRILTLASGEFKTEFDGRIAPFTEIVKQANVKSKGDVIEAAIEKDEENSGVVLVAAKQTLTNAGMEQEQQRLYRFRITVTRGEDGSLTTSDVEFVP